MTIEHFLLAFLEFVVLGFTILYAVCNSALILIGFGPARGRVRASQHSDLDLLGDVEACPPVAVLVPAYNEEVGIVEAVRAFLELDYPALEVVVVNDGSKDGTMEAMRTAYGLVRRDVTVRGDLGTAKVIGVYEATKRIPENVIRLVVVHKENGGRADALNCGINACRSPYFVTVDGDSILDPLALKHIMRLIVDDPSIQAAGGQIGVVNDCPVRDGRVLNRVVPRGYLALCQTLEYVRSFTTARSGFSRLGALLIVSGAFLLMRRDVAMTLGGFLTGRVRSKLLDEYAGPGSATVGEDMEMITRLHRYERENGRNARVVHSPLPVCWTEVPSTWSMLGRQRRRWHRGFLEILRYHGKMLFDPAYGRIGLFSFPFVALFEGLGPYLEAAGYIVLPILLLFGTIDVGHAALLAAVMLGLGMLHSMIAVLCATWLEPVVPGGSRMRSILGVDTWRDRGLLLVACVVAELGYRQATIVWRLIGTWEFFRGKQSWGSMERKGFRAAASATCVVFSALLWTAEPARAGEEAYVSGGVEHREGRDATGWMETGAKWEERGERESRALWIGTYAVRRDAGDELGTILGVGASRLQKFGGGLELRVSPGASASARSRLQVDGEAHLRGRLSATGLAHHSVYRDAALLEFSPGVVVYAPRDVWIALRASWARTSFDDGPSDIVVGWGLTANAPIGRVETRLFAVSGSESVLGVGSPEPGRIRSFSVGFALKGPLEGPWQLEVGAAERFPDSGPRELAVHSGIRRRW